MSAELLKNKKIKKYDTKICNESMTFQECELAILREAVDENDKIISEKNANSEEVKKMISILEDFLTKKQNICYGGTAINNILPKQAQFYDRDIEIPDYDFFSPNALDDAKELADIYHNSGFSEVEAKSGMHYGTYKVFVNFIPIADITYLHSEIFDSIKKEAIKVDGILYAPANFLRMNMYLELSRPMGDVSRWEKVLKRLNLLNKYYPLDPMINCYNVDFQRKMDNDSEYSNKLYYIIRDSLIKQGVVFFGGYASSLYSKYMSKNKRRLVQQIPDFDVISEEPEKTANIVVENLRERGFKHVKIIKHSAIGELIPEHFEIRVKKETMVFIYRPIACHNYNIIKINEFDVKIATIDTILSFYLAFYYTKQPYYFKDRILCIAKFLFDVQQSNRLSQRGLLERFSIKCYGKQPTVENIRAEKVEKYRELKDKHGTREYDEWFLKYTFQTEKDNTNSKSKKTKQYIKKTNSKRTSSLNKTKKKDNSFLI
jgi:hypothetical protein